MTLEEYDVKVAELSSVEPWTKEQFKALSDFQYVEMEKMLAEYGKAINNDPAKQVCYDLLSYAIHDSESGNAIVDVDYIESEEAAKELEDKIFEEIGQFLLDGGQVYQEPSGQWVADVMFGGNYVPYWDGWRD